MNKRIEARGTRNEETKINSQWPMVNAQRSMTNAQCSMIPNLWSLKPEDHALQLSYQHSGLSTQDPGPNAYFRPILKFPALMARRMESRSRWLWTSTQAQPHMSKVWESSEAIFGRGISGVS